MLAINSTMCWKRTIAGLALILPFAMLGYWSGKLRGDCAVNCTALKCWVAFGDGNKYLIENDEVANWWWVATAGCAPDKCDCTGKTKLSYRQATGTKVCDPIQTNQGQAKDCTNPTGQFGNIEVCMGCSPKQPPSGK